MSLLAPELWDLVLGHVAANARGDLLLCAQVCRVWRHLAVARFYHTVEVDVTPSYPGGSHRRRPFVLSGKTFRFLLDARSSAVDAIRALQLNLGATLDDCLSGMSLPKDHRVASLSLRSHVGWLVIDEKLRLASNFAAITSLHLDGATMDSTSVFAHAIAQFPQLRQLPFSGWILDRNFSNSDIRAPSFSQPCELQLGPQGYRTWTDVLQWVLVDISQFLSISLDLADADIFWSIFLPHHPEIIPLIHDVILQNFVLWCRERFPVVESSGFTAPDWWFRLTVSAEGNTSVG
ncbi:hypothetical protein AURDEDRAFT_170680 [Auricularia subglabra TFB-10046 SS5]|nr:hypothetical protein AURDEDRAFT_170680 [Auricularia subglabra TFB-10046 SS5]